MIIHINPIYTLWHCGADGPTTTNEKNVTCPDCLARKPIDITQHPLTPFFELVAKEYDSAVKKYPDFLWAEYTLEDMFIVLSKEVEEVEKAYKNLDINGPHGMLIENLQVANVALRINNELTRRAKCLKE